MTIGYKNLKLELKIVSKFVMPNSRRTLLNFTMSLKKWIVHVIVLEQLSVGDQRASDIDPSRCRPTDAQLTVLVETQLHILEAWKFLFDESNHLVDDLFAQPSRIGLNVEASVVTDSNGWRLLMWRLATAGLLVRVSARRLQWKIHYFERHSR